MMKHLTASDFVAMPWKNGRGVTTEFYRVDEGGKMIFRVSSAEVVESGPFSDFSGYDRTLVNLGPETMRLTHEGQPELEILVLGVTHFDGGTPTSCRVGGRTRDFNVFCAQGALFASTLVRRLSGREALPVSASTGVFIYVLDGVLSVVPRDGRSVSVGSGEALVRELSGAGDADYWQMSTSSGQTALYIAVAFRQSHTA